jgi:hypothetical protein
MVIEPGKNLGFGERCLRRNDQRVQSNLDSSKDLSASTQKKIWIPKAIGVVSTNPYYEFFGNILVDIYFTLIYDQ